MNTAITVPGTRDARQPPDWPGYTAPVSKPRTEHSRAQYSSEDLSDVDAPVTIYRPITTQSGCYFPC